MKPTITEQNLIVALRSQALASRPRQQFSSRLESKLERALVKKTQPPYLNLVNLLMPRKNLYFLALASLVVILVIVGVVVAVSQLNTAEPEPKVTGFGLPSEKVQDVEAAQAKLDYTLMLPTLKLANESLRELKVGTSSGLIDDSNTLYLTYGSETAVSYKIAQTSKPLNDPTDVEAVNLTVQDKNGKSQTVRANYYRISEWEEPQGSVSLGDALAPRSYLFWTIDGIRYEVSEFGQLAKADLVKLAESFKPLK